MSKSHVSLSDDATAWRDPAAVSIGYFAKNPLVAIDEPVLAELRALARADHQNARLSLHRNTDATFHEMVIYQHADRIHPPKKHLHKDKSFHIIEGTLAIFVFDEKGAIVDVGVLDGRERFLYRVAAGNYHADIPITAHVIHHESTLGPFTRATDSVFAPWAPDGADEGALHAFRDRLLENVVPRAGSARPIVVTGAAGFCGAALVERLAMDGTSVTGVYRRAPEATTPGPAISSVVADLAAAPLSLPRRLDTLVHAAARLGVPGSSAAAIAADNVEATRRLIDYAISAGGRKIVFLSAMGVYGTVHAPVVDENTPIVNPDAYGASKRIGEQMLAEAGREIASLSLRLPSVVGARARHGWITGLIRRLMAGDPVSFVNPNTPFNNLVHIDDLTRFISHLVDLPFDGADIAVLGAKDPIPVGEVVARLKARLNSKSDVVATENPDTPAFVIDSAYAARRYGWHPPSVVDLLNRLADDYLAQPRP